MQSKSFSLKTNHKIKPFTKSIKVDSDKSLSIRSFLISSISHDISNVKNVLESDDVLNTILALKKLGVKIISLMELKKLGEDPSLIGKIDDSKNLNCPVVYK